MSFLLEASNECILFSGDIILDSPSTVVEDLPIYMDTLYNLRNIKFDFICTTHSLDLSIGAEEHIIIPGPPKLDAYIEYRESRLNSLLNIVSQSE